MSRLGLVVELVDTADLKSAARLGRDGSSPSEATNPATLIWSFNVVVCLTRYGKLGVSTYYLSRLPPAGSRFMPEARGANEMSDALVTPTTLRASHSEDL